MQAGPVLVSVLAAIGREDDAREIDATVVELLDRLPEDHPVRVSVERMIGRRR